jgi:hypothetical protein
VGKDFLKLRGNREATVGNCSREGKDNADEQKGTERQELHRGPECTKTTEQTGGRYFDRGCCVN